ncbi:MAG: YadA-like family protein, partial [Erythrobacter sp.]|nr:YadA-like family protein [Erythrobacter sp.]
AQAALDAASAAQATASSVAGTADAALAAASGAAALAAGFDGRIGDVEDANLVQDGRLLTLENLTATAIGNAAVALAENDAQDAALGAVQALASDNAGRLDQVEADVATLFGLAGSQATGENALALGQGSMAEGDDSVAIGSGAMAGDGAAVAIGLENQAMGNGAVAIGDPNLATGNGAVAIGKDNTATGDGAIAMGDTSSALGTSALALGQQAQASGTGAIALGGNAVAAQAGAVVIGSDVQSVRADQFVLGNAGNTYTLAGIASAASRTAQQGAVSLVTTDAAGNLATLDFDVARFGQLESEVAGLSSQVAVLGSQVVDLSAQVGQFQRASNGGIAAAMAMGGTLLPPDSTFSVSFNLATYRGEQGFSGALVARATDTIWISGGIAGSTVRGSTGGRVGMTFGW